jgi:hypothetical protein
MEEEYVGWLRSLADTYVPVPAKALELLATRERSSAGKEDRSTTLLKEAFRSASHYKPFEKPTSAVLLDPPALDTYSSASGEWWAQGATSIAGISYSERNVLAILGREVNWGGWGFLLPEPSNPHDADAVAVFVQGRKVGYLPAGKHQAVVQSSVRCWRDGKLPVVRVALWNNLHLGGRVHVTSGRVVAEV